MILVLNPSVCTAEQNDLIYAWGLDTQLGYCAQASCFNCFLFILQLHRGKDWLLFGVPFSNRGIEPEKLA